jgi:hypothetical protein
MMNLRKACSSKDVVQADGQEGIGKSLNASEDAAYRCTCNWKLPATHLVQKFLESDIAYDEFILWIDEQALGKRRQLILLIDSPNNDV